MLPKRVMAGIVLVAASSAIAVTTYRAPSTGLTSLAGHPSISVDATLSHRAVAKSDTPSVWAKVTLKAGAVQDRPRPPMDVVLLIDKSGSMQGEKLASAKSAAGALLARMGDDDRLAIVSFADAGVVEHPLTALDGRGRDAVEQTIRDLRLGGGTNIGDAYEVGASVLRDSTRGAARVMFLVSDGRPTVGVTSPLSLKGIAADGLHKGEITTTTLGIGDGFDESVMGGMAVSGGGNFYYVEGPDDLERDLNTEWEGLSGAAARSIAIRLTPAPGVSIKQVYGFSTRQEGRSTIVYVDSMFAKSRRILITELDTSKRAAGDADVLDVEVAYDDVASETVRQRSTKISLLAKSVDRPLSAADVRSDVLSRVRRVASAAAVEEADRLWGSGQAAEAERVVGEATRLNEEFVAQHGSTKELDRARDELRELLRQVTTMQPEETRSIRIRKKRKMQTIEIIAGDR